MNYREFTDEEIKKLHPITSAEMQYAKDGAKTYDFTAPHPTYGKLYKVSVPNEYKDLIFRLMEGCLHNYYKYHKDNVYHINTKLGDADFSIPANSLAHIFGMEKEIMSPQSLKTNEFFDKYIPGFNETKNPLKRFELMIKHQDIIKQKEKELFKDKDILNYRKMYIKLSSYINFKELDKDVFALGKKNNNMYAKPNEKIIYTIVTKTKQFDRNNLASIQLACQDPKEPLVPKSMLRDNDVLSFGGTLILTENTIKFKKKQYHNTNKVRNDKINQLKSLKEQAKKSNKEMNTNELPRYGNK